MSDDVTLNEDGLQLKDPPMLGWVLAQRAVELCWRDNEKLHDLQSLVDSVVKYGFQEPAKFDNKLHRVGQEYGDEPQGAIKSGNGRVQAVAWLEQHKPDALPRGCGVQLSTGAWVIPMLFGTDAQSGSVAQAYAVDANNLTLSGGDLDGFDMARLWGPGYVKLLTGMDELPVSVTPEMLDALLTMEAVPPTLDEMHEEHGEPDPMDGWPYIRVCVSPETLQLWNSLLARTTGETDDDRVRYLLKCVDADLLVGDEDDEGMD